jgi:hypothetical protein
MPSKKSIIFELNNTLRVYAADLSVNQTDPNITLLREVIKEGRVLELASKFEFLWHDIDENDLSSGIDEVYFLIGPHAGFTDTRIVFVWLKSWQMFHPRNHFYLKKTSFDVPLDFVDVTIAKDFLNKAKNENNNSEIRYSREPRIGINESEI